MLTTRGTPSSSPTATRTPSPVESLFDVSAVQLFHRRDRTFGKPRRARWRRWGAPRRRQWRAPGELSATSWPRTGSIARPMRSGPQRGRRRGDVGAPSGRTVFYRPARRASGTNRRCRSSTRRRGQAVRWTRTLGFMADRRAAGRRDRWPDAAARSCSSPRPGARPAAGYGLLPVQAAVDSLARTLARVERESPSTRSARLSSRSAVTAFRCGDDELGTATCEGILARFAGRRRGRRLRRRPVPIPLARFQLLHPPGCSTSTAGTAVSWPGSGGSWA
jgi:hypothetical protein